MIFEETNSIIKEMPRIVVQPKIFRLALCVDVRGILSEGKTWSEIERKTNKTLNDALEDINLAYGNRSFRTDYEVYSKTLFLMDARCFILKIHLEYLPITTKPKLSIKFKNDQKNLNHIRVYLLSENENLNQNSFEFYGSFVFIKRIMKRLNEKCVDYKKKYETCTGRWECVDRCMNRKLIERHNKTAFGRPSNLVVDRDSFSSMEWNTSSLMEIRYENRRIIKDIRTDCLNEISGKDCVETTFEETDDTFQPYELKREIDSQIDVLQFVEEMPFSYKLTLDLVSIQSLTSGLTMLNLLKMMINQIPRFRIGVLVDWTRLSRKPDG